MTYGHIGRVARLAAAVAATGIGIGGLSGTAGASIDGTASFKLTGAATGSLHEGPNGLCTNARGAGVDLGGLQGSVSGLKNVTLWSVVVTAPKAKGGTYKINPSADTSGQLGPSTKNESLVKQQSAILNASSGTFTFSGEKGTLNVSFGTGKKTITVKGSWNCQA